MGEAYEYKVIRTGSGPLQKKLNEAGADGWRLHSITHQPPGIVAVMERRVQPVGFAA